MKDYLKLAIVALLISAPSVLTAQTVFTKENLPDSVVILHLKDEMTGKTSYFPSKKVVCLNEDKSKGFALSAFIEQDLTISDLKIKMFNIGSCVEKNEMIVLFEDDSKMKLLSWNDFNCKGDAWFRITKSNIEELSTKKIKKIRITEGRSYESYTGELKETDKDYFVRLFSILKDKKTFEYKGE